MYGADQEAVARQRQPAAGGGGVRAHLRGARHAHRGARARRAPWRCRRSRSEIEFKDVSFGYEDGHGRSTLRGVSFTVRAGQMIAIVGRSGAGKTTLVNLLPRFYDVTERRDHDRRPRHSRRDAGVAARADRHRHAGDGAVRRHHRRQHRLRHARARPRTQIEAAARAANAHDFIAAQPDGYETHDRRARPASVGRPAPAPGDRARAARRTRRS